MHGGWCFDAVADILRAKGHTVAAPDLPGMGGDEATLNAVTLDSWARFTLEQCYAMRREVGDEPVILAGHSRGGLNIGAAAQADPEAMDKLVYICALMPPNGHSGTSVRELFPRDEAMQAIVEARSRNPGWSMTPKAAADLFAQRTPREASLAAMSRLVAEPMGPLMTPMQVTQEHWGSVPRLYIECLHDRAIPIEGQRIMQRLAPGPEVVTLDSDHSPFLCMPEELAEALERAAA